jgi:hypothetical protein
MAFRILSLDGGGSWALIQVRTLIELYGEATRGHEVLRQFDLAAACSGGSIVLAGLVENLPLSAILRYFRDERLRRSIFSPTDHVVEAGVRRVFGVGPKYSAAAKLPALAALLPNTGNTKLAGAMAGVAGPGGNPVHLLIIGFDYDSNRAAFFRSAPSGKPGVWGTSEASDTSLAAAVHASTNAPLNYFDAPAELPGWPDRFWDGGVTGYNNPSVAAVVEALTLDRDPRDLAVLSLGTGTVVLPLAAQGAAPSPFATERPNPSLITDLRKLATAILDDPPDAASFIAHAMTAAAAGLPPPLDSRIVRMNPLVTPRVADGVWAPPEGWTAAQFQHLCDIDMDAVPNGDVAYIDSYCGYWLADRAPNQPIRMRRSTLSLELGHATFGEARAAWELLFPAV